jgi:hypothetical protein
LAGWALVGGGLYRMVAPNAPQADGSPVTYALLAVIALAGGWLSYRGYVRGAA